MAVSGPRFPHIRGLDPEPQISKVSPRPPFPPSYFLYQPHFPLFYLKTVSHQNTGVFFFPPLFLALTEGGLEVECHPAAHSLLYSFVRGTKLLIVLCKGWQSIAVFMACHSLLSELVTEVKG